MENFLDKTFNAIEEEVHNENNFAAHAVVVRLADIQSVPISWLWPERFAIGKLTLIVGDPNLGKSLLTATMAAIVSKGSQWPVDKTPAPIGDVILLSAEDDAADTTKPRIEAVEADGARIHIFQAIREMDDENRQVERMFSLKRDIAKLEKLLSSLPECQLLVIDPISAYLDGTESHNNSKVRGLLAPLATLAAKHKIAIVAVDHINKNSHESNPLYRPGGSLAFVAAARAVYVVTKDKNNPERRLILPIKNNLAKEKTGLAYTVVTAENGQPIIAWESEPVVMTADEALAPLEPNEERTITDEAVDFLRDLLSNGSMKVLQIQKEARQAGITDKSLRNAREKLGIKPKKSAFTGGWEWGLTEVAPNSQDDLSKTKGTLSTAGHLRNEEIEDN